MGTLTATATALAGLLPPLLLALATWAVSLARRDASLADRIWGPMIASAGVVYLLLAPSATWRGLLAVGLVVAWALRLALYITWRSRGHGEDRRYAAMRLRHGSAFGWRSLYLVFGLQALLAWLVSAPLLATAALATPQALGLLDALGLALAVFGLAYETLADAQLARWRRDPAHHGQVMQQGLWRYSRHPNYFGEACFWWGLGLLALAAGGAAAAWTLVSPLLMTVLLLKVSGVSLLEADISERRPAYRHYRQRTNAFLPGPPRAERTNPPADTPAPGEPT